MRCSVWIGVVFALIAGSRGVAAEPPCCDPPEGRFLERLKPVGGWHPYGGGLLHWWPKHCFPCSSAPDDYCRKPLPRVCWPCWPSWYTQGPPEICYPQSSCTPASKPPQ